MRKINFIIPILFAWELCNAQFSCDIGSLATVCTVNVAKTVTNNTVISGSGTLVIAQGGSIATTNPTDSFVVQMGTDVIIKSGTPAGTITGNVRIECTNLTLETGATINLNGKGFTATLGTGSGENSSGSGTGNRPSGGGHGGNGGKGVGNGAVNTPPDPGDAYGSVNQPEELGSGGGNQVYYSQTGGTGGGKVKIIVTGTTTINGTISANGTNGTYSSAGSGGGSGGSVYIRTGTWTGSANINCNGGNAGSGANTGGGGAGGRIAIYYSTKTYTGKIYASGGTGYSTAAGLGTQGYDGGAGTIYLKKSSDPNPRLIADNYNGTTYHNNAAYTPLDVTPAVQYDTLWIRKGARLNPTGAQSTVFPQVRIDTAGHLIFSSGYTFTCTDDIIMTGNASYLSTINGINGSTSGITFNVTNDLSINANSSITFNGMGYGNGTGTGAGENSSAGSGTGNRPSGGGHGGKGGMGVGNGATHSPPWGGSIYGSVSAPVTVGSGGGDQVYYSENGGAGGGAIKIVTATLTNNGTISVNGGNGTYSSAGSGGGSGGSIWIETTTWTGTGTIAANGGDAGSGANTGGGGAGGRIAIYYSSASGFKVRNAKVYAAGGLGHTQWTGIGVECGDGGAGTVYLKKASDPNPILIVDNYTGSAYRNNAAWTLFDVTPTVQYDTIWVRKGARFTPQGVQNTIIPEMRLDTGGRLVLFPGYSFRIDNDLIVTGNASYTSTINGKDSSTVNSTLRVCRNMNLVNGYSYVDFSGMGNYNVTGTGKGENSTAGSGTGNRPSGAGHGGVGGNGVGTGATNTPALGGTTYGTSSQPISVGSGGGDQDYYNQTGGDGGGAIHLIVPGTLTNNGIIRVNGRNGTYSSAGSGGGSGGSIWIETNTWAGAATASVTAIGGNAGAGANTGGGGSGGRIHICYNTKTFAGTVSVAGGTGANVGAAGTSLDDPTCSGNQPACTVSFPIELLSFSATCSHSPLEIEVQWQTATETNNDYFTIERMSPSFGGGAGGGWGEVGTVKGADNSSTIRNYEFIDESPFLPLSKGDGGIVYYRLKQTDYDGRYEYFGPISVNLSNCNENSINVLPTISSNGYFTVIGNGKADITAYTLLGQEVFLAKNQTLPFVVDLSAGSESVYLLQINIVKKIFNKKIIKQ